MTTVDRGVDYASAPKTYEDLHRIYYRFVVNVVRQAGIEEASAEDVASSILLRLYERDFLDKFNPQLVFLHDGEEHKARFKSFLTKTVLLYVRSYREKQTRRNQREISVGCDGETVGYSSWTESGSGRRVVDFGITYVSLSEGDLLDEIFLKTLVPNLRAYLATIPRRCRTDRCDLVALFDAIVEQVEERGRCDGRALQRKFGVSPTSMHSWLWWLRKNIATYMDRPLRPKRSHPRAVAA